MACLMLTELILCSAFIRTKLNSVWNIIVCLLLGIFCTVNLSPMYAFVCVSQ